MRSSHHMRAYKHNRKCFVQTVKNKINVPHVELPVQNRDEQRAGELPPACFAKPLGIHLAHISHANDTDWDVLHLAVHVIHPSIRKSAPSSRKMKRNWRSSIEQIKGATRGNMRRESTLYECNATGTFCRRRTGCWQKIFQWIEEDKICVTRRSY